MPIQHRWKNYKKSHAKKILNENFGLHQKSFKKAENILHTRKVLKKLKTSFTFRLIHFFRIQFFATFPTILELVGFGRACAHPSFWLLHAKGSAARPPTHRSFAASHSTPKNI